MSFSASTCLTYTGNTPLGGVLYFYSDFDSYTNPFGSVATNLIIGGNCPYIITGIPDGSQNIMLRDYVSGCCVIIPIQSSNLCITCNLNFTLLSASTVSQIVAGNLISSCGNINDYVVNWYGPNSTTNVGYVSGMGTQFSYNYTHPLTGTTAIFAEAGTYTPIIDRLILNGVSYSQTGGTGFNIANTNCFPTVSVGALKCDNGNSTGAFTHSFQFSGASFGFTPQPLSSTFELSSNTKYFAYRFRGFQIPDTLDITFNSVNYSNPIKLESVKVGLTDVFSNSFTTFPRQARTNFFYGRVLTLTGLTISDGDFLTLKVTPNTAFTSTNWSLDLSCKENFNCDSCLTTQYVNNPYPIILSSVTAVTASCDTVQAKFNLSGCSFSSVTGDVFSYLVQTSPLLYTLSLPTTGIIQIDSGALYWSGVSCSTGIGGPTPQCDTPNSNIITYEKKIVSGIGDFTITCSSFSDLTHFYNAYLSAYSFFSGSPTNPLSYDYYRAFSIFYPVPLTNICGDATTQNQLDIHYSSVVTTGGTGPWFINFTMPTIAQSVFFTSCDVNCQNRLDTVINSINQSSTGTTSNFSGTTTNGSKFNNSTVIQTGRIRFIYTTTPFTASTTTFNNQVTFFDYQSKTVPWSGSGNTLINSLSGQTCNFSGFGSNSGILYKYPFYYQIRLINPSDERDYEIWGSPINNGVYSGFPSTVMYELAVRYSGGSVTYSNPYYTI